MEVKNLTPSSVHVYSSSAGSGKTYTLVKEYLKILLGPAGRMDKNIYHKILAITFTNKATEEMKSRILSSLQDLSKGRNPSLASDLCEALKCSEEQIQTDAMYYSRRILHDYGNMSILTIDSFFQRIIRSFSKEIGLPLTYEIDLDQNTIVEYAVDELINDIGKSPFITQVLETYALRNVEEDESWDMRGKLIELGNEVVNNRKLFEKVKFEEIRVLEEYEQKLKTIKKSFKTTVQSKSEAILSKLKGDGITPKDVNRGTLFNYLEKLAAKKIEEINKIESGAHLRAVFFNDGDIYTKSLKEERKAIIDGSLNSGLRELIVDFGDYYAQNYRAFMSADQVLKHFYLLGLIDELSDKIKQYRKEESVLLISDIVALLSKLVTDHSAPFIFEKVGVKYNYMLIDEFQDTSNDQWNILKPFVINILSAVRPEFLHILIVGDGKQSIYRWRGGNMSLLTTQIFDDLAVFEPVKKALNDNYRSLANVVNFNNTYFNEMVNYLAASKETLSDELKRCYETATQVVKRKSSEQGGVFLRWIDAPKESNFNTEALTFLLNDVQEVRSHGYKLSDMAVLVSSGKDAFEIADFLQQNGFAVVSSNSLLYKDHPAIQFIVSIIQLCLNPKDKIALVASRKAYVSAKEMIGTSMPLHQVYDTEQKEGFPDFLSFVHRIDKLINLDIYDLLIEIIVNFKLDERRDGFLYQFLDFVLDNKMNIGMTLSDFMEWWELKKVDASALTTKENDAIEIMTVHKSKGLQFPVVFMPFCKREVSKKKGIFWVEGAEEPYDRLGQIPVNYTNKLAESYFNEAFENEEDERFIDSVNFLYVAFTRAAEQLFVYAPEIKGKSEKIFSDVHKIHTEVCRRMSIDISKGYHSIGNMTKASSRDAEETKEKNITFSPLARKAEIVKSVRKKVEGEKKRSIETGNVVHEALSFFNNELEMDHVLKKLKWQGSGNEEQISMAEQTLRKIAMDSISKSWFNDKWRVFNERSFWIHGELLRPDRIIVNDEQYIVIDYKTGNAEKKHVKQVLDYVEKLAPIFNKKGRGYLVYLKDFEVRKVV